MKLKNEDIIAKLTLEEKAQLLDGKDFWHLKSNKRVGLDEIMVTDGPHGLRKQNPDAKGSSLETSFPATCFPTAATTACSWDPNLMHEMGEALGEECLKEKVSVILGPGVNMKRSPLCGRNFEYFSEDPLLAGEMAAGLINGVQSKNVGTSLKHFAANSQEKRRMAVSSTVDERTLREIYLPAFEIAVKKAQPWTIMNAYNKINGEYCSDSKKLQKDILRDEWGFEGLVVTDWGAANDRAQGVKAGNDLEMPGSDGLGTKKIINAVFDGRISTDELDQCVDNVIELIKKSMAAKGEYSYSIPEHHKTAIKVAEQSMVLLKNDDNILPLKKEQNILVVGELAKTPRYQGAGSSHINPTILSNAFDELVMEGYNLDFAKGYEIKGDIISQLLINEATEKAKTADTILLFVGLTDEYEAEGFDRTHINLPSAQLRLIDALKKENKDIVVVLCGGSVVKMPFVSDVKAILNAELGGQGSGEAIAHLLCGKATPCGKLAETYPLTLSDTPSFKYFPGHPKSVEYRESVYIGYRYYDTAKKDVRFPFGFGLSYTTFEYSDLKLSKKKMKDTDTLSVTFKVKNTGKVKGAEICEVYVKDNESTIFRPEKELKGFCKVFLEPGEEKEVSVTLEKRAFAYYNTNINDWHVESGDFSILVGASSRDIKLRGNVTVQSTQKDVIIPDFHESIPEYYTADVNNITDSEFETLLGHELPPREFDKTQKLTIANNLEDASCTKWGGRIYHILTKALDTFIPDSAGGTAVMIKAMATELPIRNFISQSGGVFTEEMAEGLLKILNDEAPAKGLGIIIKGLLHTIKKLPALIGSI